GLKGEALAFRARTMPFYEAAKARSASDHLHEQAAFSGCEWGLNSYSFFKKRGMTKQPAAWYYC
ncbi:MAG: hypothetical protein IKG62_05270, partial [Lachnospiraceae bacterium]|nr:hypothetical protein [Lachnospiraceae bacterium]